MPVTIKIKDPCAKSCSWLKMTNARCNSSNGNYGSSDGGKGDGANGLKALFGELSDLNIPYIMQVTESNIYLHAAIPTLT